MFKVAYVLNSTMQNAGDNKAFMDLVLELIPQGIKPIVIVPNDSGIYSILKIRGIDVQVLNYKHNTYPRLRTIKDIFLFVPRLLVRLWLNHMAISRLVNILEDRKVQLVHTNVSVVDIGCKAARKLGLPHIYHFREYADLIGFKYLPSKKSFYKSITRNNDYCICITKGIQKYHHLHNHNSQVIYDGVKKRAATIPVVLKRNYFLYAGRIEPNKGLFDLLEAYNDVVAEIPTFPVLKVAGAISDVFYTRMVKNFVKKHNLEHYVDFLGERDDIDWLMQQAIALIVPSKFEGFGFCMAEAMYNGCVVVGYNDTGTKEQFDNGLQLTGASIGFPYNTQKELSQLLIRLSEAPQIELAPIRQRAFQSVNELYSVEDNSRRVYEFYKYIIDIDKMV